MDLDFFPVLGFLTVAIIGIVFLKCLGLKQY